METGREDVFFRISFSYRGSSLSPLTCNTQKPFKLSEQQQRDVSEAQVLNCCSLNY